MVRADKALLLRRRELSKIHLPATPPPWRTESFKLLDNCTVYSGPTIPGRININLAPRTVLMCIPGMTQDLCDQIVANRIQDPNTARP